MCGIAGILPKSPGLDVREPLVRMQRALRHRGPDDEGLAVLPSGAGGFAHTRLSILDLSSAGHQPMEIGENAECGRRNAESEIRNQKSEIGNRYWITFNGEIYNFQELREEMARDGVVFHSDSDTEVILRLYERLGPKCVERLRGMFAFAIWDRQEETCFLARDPLGIKPLYYYHTPELLLFASELRAILASNLVPRKLNPVAVFGYFQSGSVPEPVTLLQGVRCLRAGHTLRWRNGELTEQRFWSCRFEPRPMERNAVVLRVREALLDSVQKHFISDVPVGIFLSGGIDSTALVALARIAGQTDLRTFSISLDDPVLNEGGVAQKTARHFATQHLDLRLDAATGRDLFKGFLGCVDQPSVDGFNTFTVAKFAHDQGMKVVLSGLGGDELFGGYPSFTKVPQMIRWSQRLSFMEPLRNVIGHVLENRSNQPRLRRLGYFLQHSPTARTAFGAYRGIYATNWARKLAASLTNTTPEEIEEPMPELSTQPTLLDEVTELEIAFYMRNQLLRDSDVMSMAWGLELRVPFVDRCLVDTLSTIPAAIRAEPGKKLLLDAVPEIPSWVAEQPKRGFAFPFEEWLAGDWKDMFESAAVRHGIRVQTWYQKWSLFVFKRWCAEMNIPHG